MNITEQLQGEIVLLGISGRLDANTSGSLEAAFAKLTQQGNGKFVFDLQGLEYVSSAGLRSLLSAAKMTKVIGGKLALARMNEHVKEVFDMSGFSSIFAIYATEADAIDAIS
ncbi:STAS domain-containing protein [Paenibacillus sp. GCM10023248]|uniref:STAS domain-containing protein n=1 Tax=Bacillales TaxID=1385 RepID=UPI0023797349|nr:MULTISPECIES: STAS domain-containing protein [Bacillales]MDD9266824.1 STAS domain-containing protein [Paenibacillus sp. MAHUQ-63]MDR6881022.1 anti-sigma B factor antagonist [Bacillus sp. 3255]